MRRAVAALALVLAASAPAGAARAAGPANDALGLSVLVAEGTEISLACPEPADDVDAFYVALTVTNAEGPKAGRINGLAMAAYASNLGDVFVYASAGDTDVGASLTTGVEPPLGREEFENGLTAAYPSIVRFGVASWGAPYACTLEAGGTPLTPGPLDPAAARALRSAEFAGGVGLDTTAGDVSIGQETTLVADGYLFAILTCASGSASADGPEGQRYSTTGSALAPAFPITVAEPTAGEWRFARASCVDTFAPVLWTLVLPA